MFFLRSMVAKLVFWSVVLLVLVGYTGVRALWNNQNAGTQRDFTYWQGRYRDIAAQLAPSEEVRQAALSAPIEVKQVTVTQFPLLMTDGTQQMRVDRCQSCHIGLENPQMTAENIIKTVDGVSLTADQVADYLDKHEDTRNLVKTIGAHPGIDIEGTGKPQDLGVVHSNLLSFGVATQTSPTAGDQKTYALDKTNLKQHPFPTFGCTTCHYGQGRDLVLDKAHGSIEKSLTPLLPSKYMEAACAQCHTSYDAKTFTPNYLPQMTTIARGEQLFKQQACYGCHKIEGLSKGNIGPELTYEGRVAGTYLTIEHQLWDPRYKVNGCVMPYFFSAHAHNTDDPFHTDEKVDPRAEQAEQNNNSGVADLDGPGEDDIRATLKDHGYIPLKEKQTDVDALVTFIVSQTGLNYSVSPSDRFTNIASYNLSNPSEVPVTVAEGKTLFTESGCYACHYIGQSNVQHVTGDPKFGHGGIFGPELSWEGSRHSQQWLIAHYKNPQEFVPGSIMPIFPFSDTQRAALSLYDASQMPAGGRPVSQDQDLPGAQQQKNGAQVPDVRYALPLGQGQH